MTSKPANAIMVEIDGVKISVANYFLKTYNINLKYPWLPCIMSGSKGQVNIPFELCIVRPNQRHLGKLSDDVAAEMIKITASQPAKRLARIEVGFQSLQKDPDLLASWGVVINPKMVSVNARQLAPPTISFQKTSLVPNLGSWRVDGKHCYTAPATLAVYSFAVFVDQRDLNVSQTTNFIKTILDTLKERGMNIYVPSKLEDLIVYQKRRGDVENTLLEAFKVAQSIGSISSQTRIPRSNNRKVDLIFCIIQAKNIDYAEIKKFSECTLDVMTQCMLRKNVEKAKVDYWYFLLIKCEYSFKNQC